MQTLLELLKLVGVFGTVALSISLSKTRGPQFANSSWKDKLTGLVAGLAIFGINEFLFPYCTGSRKRLHMTKKKGDSDLSERGAPLLDGHGPPSYIMEHIMRLGEPFCAKERPEGYICLAISENRLAFPFLKEALSLVSTPPHISTTCYDNPRGGQRFREATAAFLCEHVAERRVHADAIASAAGATAVLHNLFFVIADPGDVCLVPTPYFTGFDSILSDPRLGLVVKRLPSTSMTDIDCGISVAVLDAALRETLREGRRVAALLLTSPHNPTGLFYSERTLRAAVSWAGAKGVQVVVDEVYSNTLLHAPGGDSGGVGSRSRGGGGGFKSMLQLYNPLPPHVHVCWGFSKIFGVAGWRAGVLVTESNAAVMGAFASLLHPHECSTETLHTLSALLECGGVHRYLAQTQAALRQALQRTQDVFREAGVPVIVPQSGLYLLIDLSNVRIRSACLTHALVGLYALAAHLRGFLPPPASVAAEEHLWQDILRETKVNLTPGAVMHCHEPGWFRVCFASQSSDVLAEALSRLSLFLARTRPLS